MQAYHVTLKTVASTPVTSLARNPLLSWFPEDAQTFEELLVDVSSCSPQVARAVIEAFPRGVGIESARPAELRALGMSDEQAKRVVAAFGLSRLVVEAVESRRTNAKLRSVDGVCAFLAAHMGHLDTEKFVVILLDAQMQVLDVLEAGTGSVDHTMVMPRDLFAAAIRLRAPAIIVAHNHPSGDAEPSADDIEMTAKVQQAGWMLGIRLVDHLVVGRGPGGQLRCTSMAARGHVYGP